MLIDAGRNSFYPQITSINREQTSTLVMQFIMPRPTTKALLQTSSEESFCKLFELINSMTTEEKDKPFSFDDRDKNIRDVLTHLFEWHQLLLNWVNSNSNGIKADFLPQPYNWKTYPQMNIEFCQKHRDTSLQEAIELLNQSHLAIKNLVNWTGSTSLGSYCISATSSHYNWALKKIKQHKKSLITLG